MKPAILILTMSFKVARTSDFLFSHFHVIHPRHRIYISHCGSEALKLLRSALPPVAKGKAEEAGQVVLNLRVSKV